MRARERDQTRVALNLSPTGPLNVTSQPSASWQEAITRPGLDSQPPCTCWPMLYTSVQHIWPLFTDQLLAPNQKGQVGVLGRGRKEGEDYAQLFLTGNEEAALRMRLGGVRPWSSKARNPQWWWAWH